MFKRSRSFIEVALFSNTQAIRKRCLELTFHRLTEYFESSLLSPRSLSLFFAKVFLFLLLSELREKFQERRG